MLQTQGQTLVAGADYDVFSASIAMVVLTAAVTTCKKI